jgi:Protein of unknown function (DUF3551)
MRLPILLLFLIAAALLGEIQAASAQSPYSYPWCSRGVRSVPGNCYYTSKEQCQRTISGNGGFRIRNPSYRGLPASRDKR